ncbi:MAG: M14 family zinc carboxypeptidase [Anaerolineae bacterium]
MKRILPFVLILFSWGCSLTAQTPALPTLQPTAVLPTAAAQHLPTLPPPATATTQPVTTAVSPTNTAPAPPTETAVIPPTTLPTPEPAAAVTAVPPTQSTIGFSSQGRPLISYQFGSGPDAIVLIGGIHGGYEWNTITLAYRAIDYFTARPDAIPASVTLYIIPAANPDGQYYATGQNGRFSAADVLDDGLNGRLNGHNVDLNRNWDCKWQEIGLWRDQPISGGAFPFSEPETVALRDFLVNLNPYAVVFWHSAANGVYPGGCHELYQPAYTLAQIYGLPAGYPVYERFTSYKVTGDATDWLGLQGIPAISVELLNHTDDDWAKNLKGITAVLNRYQEIDN